MTARQRRLAVFAALNVLIVVVGWFALVSPQRHDAASAATQEQAVQSELAALTGSSQSSNKQPAIHTSGLYALDTALPAQEDQPDLLFELDRLAKASDVEILGITPQPPQATTGYTVQPINLELSGTYFHLTRFLRSLRILVTDHRGRLIANGSLFAVTSVALSPGTSAGTTTSHDETAVVGMAAFYYGVVGGAVPPASTTTTTTTTTTGG
jgi:Pilus assembly protein, PilO